MCKAGMQKTISLLIVDKPKKVFKLPSLKLNINRDNCFFLLLKLII